MIFTKISILPQIVFRNPDQEQNFTWNFDTKTTFYMHPQNFVSIHKLRQKLSCPQTDRQTCIRTDIHTDTQPDRQMGDWTGGRGDRQADRQTQIFVFSPEFFFVMITKLFFFTYSILNMNCIKRYHLK